MVVGIIAMSVQSVPMRTDKDTDKDKPPDQLGMPLVCAARAGGRAVGGYSAAGRRARKARGAGGVPRP